MKTKKCSTCKELKTYDSFYKDKNAPTGYGYECKRCKYNGRKAWIARSPESYQKQRKKAREINRFKGTGFTPEDFDYKIKEQDYKCAICGTDDPGKTNWHADHCHATGIKRGVLCMRCNTALGFLDDDTDRLANAILYLNYYQTAAKEQQ